MTPTRPQAGPADPSPAPRPRLVPFFLSGCHCPVGCVYCDRETLTGGRRPLDGAAVREAVRRAVADTRPGDRRPLGVAFYGGTFTALPPAQQDDLLRAAADERAAGRVAHVRLSTHPHWLAPRDLERLRAGGVDTIEVGVQSLDDGALARAQRGVTAAETLAALERVRAAGFELGVQLMVGLPGADRAADADTARRLAGVGAALARVYPTIVLRGAALAELWAAGAYVPLSLDEAVVRAADQVVELEAGGVTVQRIGLHVDDALRRTALAGPVHPALGEQVRAELAWRRLLALVEATPARRLVLRVPPRERSRWLGHRRANVLRFEDTFPTRHLEIRADPAIRAGDAAMEAAP